MKQRQFLEVLERDEAERRWRAAIDVAPLARRARAARAARSAACWREDVRAEVDVPGFDRSNMDGFAVRAADTFGASEAAPVRLALGAESDPDRRRAGGRGARAARRIAIATGGMLPRGADAVVARRGHRRRGRAA